jgi:hypothetical protein
MTITVNQSITLNTENGRDKTIQRQIRSDYFEDDLTALFQELRAEAAKQIFSEYEHKMKAGVSVRTEKRRYQFQDFSVEYRRRTIRMPDGTERKPLDELLGFEKYQRQSLKAIEQVGAIVSDLSYRKTAEVISYMTKRATSASTIGRQVWRLGKWLGERQMRFEASKPGAIAAPQLFGEADGIWVPLQKAGKKKKVEIRVAIAYTGKKYISKKRKRLLNKTCLTATGIESQPWQVMIREHLYAKYKLEDTKQLYVGGDGGNWVGSSFDFLGIKKVTRILDPYHVKKAITTAFGDSIDSEAVIEELYKQGFGAIEKTLLDATVGATEPQVKKRIECLNYLRNNAEFIVRGPSMGAIESNVGKLIAQRMKTRGVSWSRAGAIGMPLLILYKQELYEKSFKFEALKAEKKKQTIRKRKKDESSVHKASFTILKTGKISTPYATLFKAIINDDLPLSS